jgi:hypothetical protein
VLENRVMKIFGPKRDDVIGKWRAVHNFGHHKPYFLPNTIRAIISRIRWARHVVRVGGKERCTHGFSRKICGKENNGETGGDWSIILKWIFNN